MTRSLDAVRSLCDQLKIGARPQKQKTIDLLWTVLETMRRDGSPDYSIARVGRELALRGGPKTQSIRNARGAYLREIIGAYAEALKAPLRKEAQASTNVDRALSLIADQNIRYILTLEIQVGRKLRVENQILRETLRRTTIQAEQNTSTQELKNPRTKEERFLLSKRLTAALQKAIDPNRLDEMGLFIREDGAILDDRGDVLMPPSFTEAVQRVLLMNGDQATCFLVDNGHDT